MRRRESLDAGNAPYPQAGGRMADVSPAWVVDHASGRRRPYLPSVKLGKAVRFRREDVEQFIEDCLRLEQRLRAPVRRATASW